MGNDGGSIPTRRELVKEAARDPSTTQVKETQTEQQQYHWTTCPLSHQPLRAPIVSDSSGLLYSKDALLEYLLETGLRATQGDDPGNEEVVSSRVRSLRDVVEVKLQVEEISQSEQSKSLEYMTSLKWVCPITKKRLGPGVKAVYLVPCGHAFLESAVREISGENCLQCNEPYTAENVIPILPSSVAEKQRLKERAQILKGKGLTHSLKKATGEGKKRKKNIIKAKPLISDATQDDLIISADAGKIAAMLEGSIKNEETALLTAKVLAEEQDRSKRRKVGTNDNLKSLFSSRNGMAEKHTDFMTRGFSIPAGAKR